MERVNKNHWLYTRPIAHRGLHDERIPENSMAAFRLAVEAGYAIETDTQLSQDGVLVLCHDRNLSRITGGKDSRAVADVTYEELKTIKLLDSDETIPTLRDLLAIAEGKSPILLELKSDNRCEPLCAAVAAELDSYHGEYAVQSFHPYVLKWFKKKRPDWLRGQLSSFFEGSDMSAVRRTVLKRMTMNRATRPNFISYDLNDLPNPYVDKYVKKHPIPVLAWTVHCPHCLAKSKGVCDNIIFENIRPVLADG